MSRFAAAMAFTAGIGLGAPLPASAQTTGDKQSDDDFAFLLGEDQSENTQAGEDTAAPTTPAAQGTAPDQQRDTTTQQAPLEVIPVRSQSDAAPPTTAAASRKGGAMPIEEIVVSATKRDTSLMQTGIAISVLDSEQMKLQDMSNLEDMQNSVPGLRVGTIVGTPLITIRGVGMNFIGGLGNPGVAAHYDSIYLPRTGSTLVSTVDLDRVEVLRGPQGTLYGRNATGGSVNFISKRPGHDFAAGLSLGAGDYGRRYYEGYIESPALGDDLAMRAYFKRDFFDGYGVNETDGHDIGGNDAISGRMALTYRVTDALDAYAGYSHRKDEGAYPYSTAMTTVTSLSGREFPADEVSFEPYNIKGLIDPFSEKTTDIGNLTLNWVQDGYTLKSITGYVGHQRHEYDSAGEIERFVIYIFRNDSSDTWSQEFNLSGKWFDDTLNWLVGLYYALDDGSTPFGAHINLDELFAASTPTGQVLVFDPTPLTADTTKAAFVDGSWSMLDTVRLVFGVRLSEERRELTQTFHPYVEDRATGLPVSSTVTQTLLDTGLLLETCDSEHHARDYASTDPKLGIEWDVFPETMVYAQYQTAFKAGGFNSSNRCNQSYEPERIKSYEMGLKTSLLDGGIVLNSAVFSYDYTDYQVEKVEGFGSVIENAAAATVQGLEIETVVTPTSWINVDFKYSFLDATYDEYMSRDNFNSSTAFSQDAPVEDLSGNRLSRSPRHSFTLGATLSADVGRYGLGRARFRVEGFHSDDVYFREFNRPVEKQDAYTTYDAFLSVDSASEKVSVSLFAKNLTDERYQIGQIPFDTIRYRGAYYAPPRTLGASLTVRW